MAVVVFGCTNPALTSRNGTTITYGHYYEQDNDDLKSVQRACTCGTLVPHTYAVDARLRCYECHLVVKPWEGLMCPDCNWPMQRMEVEAAVGPDGQRIMKQVASKAQRQYFREQLARRDD